MINQIANQFKKPTGFTGAIIGLLMKHFHKPVYRRLIENLSICENDKIFEIGYGTGDAIKLIAKINSKCKISGIDFSELMYTQTLRNTKSLIDSGRVEIFFGDFLTTSMNGHKYTKVFCINVVYFWDDLDAGFRKVYEMLELQGVFSIYMESAEYLLNQRFTKTAIFNTHSIGSVQTALKNVGFRDTKIVDYSGRFKTAYFIFSSK